MSETHTSRVIVVGGGLAGLACTMKLASCGITVDFVALSPAKRSHSVCAQGGINAALNMKDEDDSCLIHAYETIKGGDFLGNQPPIVEMCMAAPKIIMLFDRMGCSFNRTPEQKLDTRRFGGTLYSRTVFCGASTGQQLVYTLDEQVRSFETIKMVNRYEHHDFMRLVHDENGRACGIIMNDLYTNTLMSLKADAVVIATGGIGGIFRKSTNSTSSTGSALGKLFMQGLTYANPEFIQIHPTAIPGEDKLRLMSESIRGEGGRIWTYGDSSKSIVTSDGKTVSCGKTNEPWYFLEELYPAYGNLVPRDIASREILRVCELGLGVNKANQVYLDVRHLSEKNLAKLTAVLDIYHKFTGEDPRISPMRIFPAMHYNMGGAYVDWPAFEDKDRDLRYRQMSNREGCFVIGEADFEYHGANRLGANSLLSCIFSGLVAANEIPRYIGRHTTEGKESSFTAAIIKEEEIRKELLSRNGSENLFRLHEELASILISNVTVKRNNTDLLKTMDEIFEIRDRLKNISIGDKGSVLNQTLTFARDFTGMIELALAMTKGAYLRNESRGAHAKDDFPERNDNEWLKTTLANYEIEEPRFTYKPVDCRYVKPEKRDYTFGHKGAPEFTGLPSNIKLPL